VLDSRGRLPLAGELVQTARELPVLVAVTHRAPAASIAMLRDAGCTVLSFEGDQVPIGPLLDALGKREMTNLLVEGGGRVLGAFLDAGEVDAVDVFIAPKIAGGPPRFVPAWGEGVGLMAQAWGLGPPDVSMVDGDIRVRGTLHRPWLD
jgi:diaminohydroxyphosphoribosylaminopyrimidine deaminase/5-amino-6-(5-phosphoribosylamino)uracil reductase